jgi:hypothetical protein
MNINVDGYLSIDGSFSVNNGIISLQTKQINLS